MQRNRSRATTDTHVIISVRNVSTEASVCLHAKTNQQKPKCGKKKPRLVFHRRWNEAWDSSVSTCRSSARSDAETDVMCWRVVVLSCSNRNNTDLSFDEVELGVTLHTSRALEDEERGKTGCYTTCWAQWIRAQQQLQQWTDTRFYFIILQISYN